MLSSAELDGMRAAVGDLFPDTLNILGGTLTPNGMGGGTIAWGTVSLAVPCRADKATGSVSVAGASRQPFDGYVFSMGYSVDIDTTNRIEFGTSLYAVVDVNADQSWPIVKRVSAEAL